jgi:hypothetical protein
MVGQVTSFLVDELLNHRKKRLAREAMHLTSQEQDLLFVIQTASRNRRLLLSLDHLETWDDSSWSLLGLHARDMRVSERCLCITWIITT